MTPLRELLEVYKKMLEWSEAEPEKAEREEVPWEMPKLQERIAKAKPIDAEKVHQPEEGDILEIVPPPDPIGMWFLVYKVYSHGITFVLPISPFYEFATPYDHLILIHRKPYIVQTDLGMDVPTETFLKHFPGQPYRIARAKQEDMDKIQRILNGEERGAGPMTLSVHEEFKNIESERYSVILSSAFFGEIKKQEVSQIFESQKELALAAAEEEPLWGRKEDFSWTYNQEDEKLIIFPAEKHLGKNRKIVLSIQNEEFILFQGALPEKIHIPLKKDSYSFNVVNERVRIEDAEQAD